MNLEIFSDLVCPWCFIGKRRLDRVLGTPVAEGVNVIWRAYQLYPGIPVEGMDRKEFMMRRYGGSDQSGARSQLQRTARDAGINMDFGRSSRMPNTFLGHRLMHRARDFGVQHELADTLFCEYFEHGRDVGDPGVLLAAAVRHGMDPEETAAFLASEESTVEVQRELDRAQAVGVSGVPCFLAAGAFTLPGAQEAEVIGLFLERAKTKLAESA